MDDPKRTLEWWINHHKTTLRGFPLEALRERMDHPEDYLTPATMKDPIALAMRQESIWRMIGELQLGLDE